MSKNYKAMENAFFKTFEEIKQKTIKMRDSLPKTKTEQKYSERSIKISKLIKEAKFGCKEQKLIEIVELMIEEELPNKNDITNDKYHMTLCKIINSNTQGIVCGEDIINFMNIERRIKNNKIIYLNNDEIKEYEYLLRKTIEATDIEDYLGMLENDDFLEEMIGKDIENWEVYF